jgi:hypothetical protein
MLNLTPLGQDLMEYMEGVGLTGPHVSPDRVFGGPKVTFSKFQTTSGIGHVADVDHLM